MVLALEGFTIGVTADRRREEQAELLKRQGATVIHAPCIRTLALGAEEGMRAATDALIASPADFVVANTAIGIRGWLASAAAWGVEDELLGALAAARILARGPKAAGTLRAVGIDVWWQAPSEQLAEVRDHLVQQPLRGRRVAIQLHGDDKQEVGAAVRAAGATTIEVPIYRWTRPEDCDPAFRLVGDVTEGRVAAVTFTAAPALRNFLALAEEGGMSDAVRDAFNNGVIAACIGPVCAAVAERAGIRTPLVPERWRLGALVHALGQDLTAGRLSLLLGGVEVVIQGAVAVVDGVPARLSERERAVLGALARRPGAPVAKAALLREVWGPATTDPHVLEVTVARLRAKLGPAGAGIETAVRRGYRIAAG